MELHESVAFLIPTHVNYLYLGLLQHSVDVDLMESKFGNCTVFSSLVALGQSI
jgi:hypothetical protein